MIQCRIEDRTWFGWWSVVSGPLSVVRCQLRYLGLNKSRVTAGSALPPDVRRWLRPAVEIPFRLLGYALVAVFGSINSKGIPRQFFEALPLPSIEIL